LGNRLKDLTKLFASTLSFEKKKKQKSKKEEVEEDDDFEIPARFWNGL
jgi:hypothetical protein